ncbi:MAG TPA: rod shape-determining protein MreD [Streptosporangiaceae bacterium]|nr:rod shape-determining protein MreD [Streptosporangiaceae bacterium]
MSRNVLAAAIAVLALVLQVAVANRLPLPGAVTPDLVLLAVVALALTNGPMLGMVTGFGAGLAADIVPPADHTIGRYALVYCLIGYACGLLAGELDRTTVVPFVVVATGALVGTVLYAGVGMLLDDPRATWPIVSHIVPLAVLYDVLASPFVLWAVLRLSRRADGGVTRDRNALEPTRYRALQRERV